jgi:transcription elongation GreA/GreB family factor
MARPDKRTVMSRFRESLTARRAEYERELESLEEADAAETKSSVGDKYETGREMIAQSRVVIERNLAETKANLETLDRLAATASQGANGAAGDKGAAGKVGLGSLVETSLGWFLVGVSLGESDVDGQAIRTLSLASPLFMALRGKAEGDEVPWRGATVRILRVE